MNEMPRKFKAEVPSEDSSERELDIAMELAVVQQVIIDEAPEGWKERIDHNKLSEHRTEIQRMSDDEIIAFCKNNYVWDDPTYAKALIDVIGGKITPPL